jgi:hypothetical protein
MKKIIISAVLALMLVAVLAVPAMGDDITASVTVTEYASVTVTDNGTAGLSFGSMTPGQDMKAEAASPSVTVTAAAENNIDLDIKVSGTDFSDGGSNSFSIGNAYYNTASDSGSASAMSTTPATVDTLSAGEHVDIYHWLSVPEEQAAATYDSTFTYVGES